MAERLGKWYEKLLTDAKAGTIPFYFVRFEDLVSQPKTILYDLMSLLINKTQLGGTNAQRRIEDVIAMGDGATVVYSLKSNTKVPNKNES